MLATADESGVLPQKDKSIEELSEKFFENLRSVDEVAQILKVNRATVYKVLSEGKLPRVKIVGKTHIPVEELMRYRDEEIARARKEADRIVRQTPRPRRSS